MKKQLPTANCMKKLVITLSLFFLFTTKAHALTISAIPPRLELTGNPGETLTAQVKVHNDSDSLQNYTVTIEDFIVADAKGTPIPVIVPNSRWSLQKWITAPNYLPVDSRTFQTINLTIRIPRTALPGGHFAMIIYTPADGPKAGEQKKTASSITQRVGTLIYVTVRGKVSESAMLSRFSIPKFNEFGPVDISGTVESISDVHVNPKGSVSIFNPLNRKVAEFPLEVGNVFPDTSRDFSLIWNQKWGWGRYKANLNLVYGSTSKVLVASVFFWLFPIRLVIYTLIFIISILTAIILLRRRALKHELALEKEVKELKKELDQKKL
jgi:hypothetical protein